MMKFRYLLLCVALLCCASSCGKNMNSTENVNFSFDTKEAHRITEDGWVYYSAVDYCNGSQLSEAKEISYDYGAYNLKYKVLKGYDKIPIVDKKSKIVTGYADSSIPYLLLGKERDNLQLINDFINSSFFEDTITDDDVKNLDFSLLDQDLFLNLYNEMIVSEDISDGLFYNWKEADIVQGDLIDGYKWQIGYYVRHGVLIDIQIEIIVTNGEQEINLSDLQAEDADDVYEKINEIENAIVKAQSFDSIDFSFSLGGYDFSGIHSLITNINII